MGYIRKALEKGYLEHPGLHAIPTTSLRFLSVLDNACVPCYLFFSTSSYHVRIQILHGLLLPPMHHNSLWCVKGLALGVQSGCRWLGGGLAAGKKSSVQPVRSNLRAPTRKTRFCPRQRPLLLQANFGIVKYIPRRLHNRSFGPCGH